MSNEFLYKILILGDYSVGKTSFLNRYVSNSFLSKTLSTLGVEYVLKNAKMKDGSIVKMQIWDTVGQERFRTITKSFFKGAHAIVLIFSVIDSDSFNNVRKWITQIRDSADKDVILILAGNKNDCEDRKVDKSEAEELANEFDIKYFDCSAKTGENINKAFEELIETMVKTVDISKVSSAKLTQKVFKDKKGRSCC